MSGAPRARGQCGPHPEAVGDRSVLELTTFQQRPLPHVDEAASGDGRGEPGAGVVDGDDHVPVRSGDRHTDPARGGVPGGVGERLLHDAVRGPLGAGYEVDVIDVQVDLSSRGPDAVAQRFEPGQRW